MFCKIANRKEMEKRDFLRDQADIRIAKILLDAMASLSRLSEESDLMAQQIEDLEEILLPVHEFVEAVLIRVDSRDLKLAYAKAAFGSKMLYDSDSGEVLDEAIAASEIRKLDPPMCASEFESIAEASMRLIDRIFTTFPDGQIESTREMKEYQLKSLERMFGLELANKHRFL